MKKTLLAGLAIILLWFGISGIACATIIDFDPQNGTGHVWSTNSNDGYSGGRGMLFSMSEDVTIDSLGLYHDLTSTDLSYEISLWNTSTNSIDSVLRQGNSNVSTAGLEWIDFGFSDLTLLNGQTYHFNFTHTEAGNQNYFYDQGNGLFSMDGFNLIDGTSNYNTANFVVSAFRVNTVDSAPVPEPATMLLFGTGLVGLVGFRIRKNKK